MLIEGVVCVGSILLLYKGLRFSCPVITTSRIIWQHLYLIKLIRYRVLYRYFMHVCSIVQTITPRCRGRPDALLPKAEGRVQ